MLLLLLLWMYSDYFGSKLQNERLFLCSCYAAESALQAEEGLIFSLPSLVVAASPPELKKTV
jgi:hypothetical protein